MPKMLGANPSPRYKLAGAKPFAAGPAPLQKAYVPKRIDAWGNDRHGDCVSAEEAFAKSADGYFFDAATVEAWARAGGFLEGANLIEVMDAMSRAGFRKEAQLHNDGSHRAVDFSRQDVLQSAIAVGPVKIGIDHRALPQTAGGQSGWHATGGSRGQYGNLDHCVSLCGYGQTDWLYQQLGAQLPPSLPLAGYLLFTWNSIGFVDHAWVMSCCGEAWVRQPTTVGVPPLGPEPPPAPLPPAPSKLFNLDFRGTHYRKGDTIKFRAPIDIPPLVLQVFNGISSEQLVEASV